MIGACFSKISQAIKISYKYTAPKNKYANQRIIYRKTKTVSDNFYEIFARKACSKKQSRPEIKNGRVCSTKIETVVNRCKSSVTRGRTMIKRISPTIVDMYFHLFSVVICLFLPLLLAPFLPSFLPSCFISFSRLFFWLSFLFFILEGESVACVLMKSSDGTGFSLEKC